MNLRLFVNLYLFHTSDNDPSSRITVDEYKSVINYALNQRP